MKKIMVACLAFLVSVSAFAATAYMDTVSRQVSWFRPDKAVHPETKQEFKNPSDGTLVACGFVLVDYEDCDFKYRLWGWEPSPWCRAMTQEERDDKDADDLAAQAEAEALRGPAPEVFVPMLNSDGDPVGTARLVVIEGSLSVLASTNSASPQKPWAEQKDQILAQLGIVAESRASAAAARLAIKQTVLAGELSEGDLAQIVDLWPSWAAGVSYAVDKIVRHGGTLYKVVQSHTSQPDWTPDAVPALFAAISPPGIIAAWVQPTGAHDSYSLGDLVMHVGQTWESTVDNNSWEPGVYGWVEVEL